MSPTGAAEPRIACVGECMVELRERPDGLFERRFGGDTLNTAIYLARLGVPVDYVTALGTDPFSDGMVEAWRQEGVGTGLVLRVSGRLPGLYLIQTDPSGERRFSHWREAAPVRDLFRQPEAAKLAETLPGYGAVYLSGITLSLFTPEDRQRLFGLLDTVRAQGGRIVFDSNFRPRGWPDRAVAVATYQAMLARCDIVIVSAEDVGLLTGLARVDEAALRSWLGASVPEAVLRFADLSCRVLVGDRATSVPGRPASQVIDTTAAGDSFAAAYMAARLRGAAVVAAAQAAHDLAGVVVQHPGAIIPAAAMAGRGRVPR